MQKKQTSYLQKAWGDSIDNISIKDVITAIQETIEMDAEHGAFWVGIGDNEEYVLETHKDLIVIGILKNSDEIRRQFQNWQEIESLYELLLNGEYDKIQIILKEGINNHKQLFKHYKGNMYELLHYATHSETQEELVVYRALYGEYGVWVRPKEMFFSMVMVDGVEVRRFAEVEG